MCVFSSYPMLWKHSETTELNHSIDRKEILLGTQTARLSLRGWEQQAKEKTFLILKRQVVTGEEMQARIVVLSMASLNWSRIFGT